MILVSVRDVRYSPMGEYVFGKDLLMIMAVWLVRSPMGHRLAEAFPQGERIQGGNDMNATVRKVKITSAQIIALREASMGANGQYAVTTAKGQTVNALIRAGIVVPGTRLLTVQGVSVYHSVSDVSVIASKGFVTYVSDAPEALETFTLGDESTDATGDAENGVQSVSGGSVEIQGAEGFDMIPEMSELTGECYFGCGRPVTGMWCDYVGRTEGVCDLDRDKLGDHITVLPVDPAIWGGRGDDVPVVAVVQNTPGMSGATHYHAPGCRDIAREMKRYGQRQSDVMEFSFKSVAEILTFEYGDIASDNAEENTAEWWANILENAQYDRSSEYGGMGVKIMPCLDIPMGTDNDGNPLQDKGSFYCFGFRQPTAEMVAEIAAEIAAHTCDEKECIYCEVNAQEAFKLTCGTCGEVKEIDGPWNVSVWKCSDCVARENDESDGGFVETLVTKEYELSVMVDEITGTRVSLGWVTLTMNAAQAHDWDRVAEEYGRTQNTRTPRHGWASIITVHDVADI
jgi:hypothetical protein